MKSRTVPFDPELFVDRAEERKLFFDTVHARRQQTYLEFKGIAGQGKSELLKWICYNESGENYFSVYVDFESPDYHMQYEATSSATIKPCLLYFAYLSFVQVISI